MRHIPEEELHAYLDQALSRGQCVEIECHLAECWRCRRERDTLASLRDRTTALLGVLGPRRLVVPPPVDAIRRQSRRLAFRRSVRWTGTWAAALGSAVFGGFALHSYLDRQSPARVAVASEEPAALLGGPRPHHAGARRAHSGRDA